LNEKIWRCDLVPQYEKYKEEIDDAIHKVLSSGRYILGDNIDEFEQEFADYIGCRFGVTVSNGTSALIQALLCFGLQKGDEVITTSFTAIPTFAAICHVGAKPVFVDVDPETYLLDLNKVENAITEKTKAIVPVHLFGNVVDIEKLRGIVGDKIRILEDCAQSHGAEIRKLKAGSLGDLAAFSFYPTKNLGGYGDSGMVLTNCHEFASAIKIRRMCGMVNKDEFITAGVNDRMDEIQAAILRTKLKHLDQMNDYRQQLVENYLALLNSKIIVPQNIHNDVNAVHHVFSLRADNRDGLVTYLEQQNIQSNVYYPMPLYKQQGYRALYGDNHVELPVVERICKEIIALPMYPELQPDKVEYISACVNSFYNNIS
jgi:dTDP-4-amino-4,6-dideoxygalactose transaminase